MANSFAGDRSPELKRSPLDPAAIAGVSKIPGTLGAHSAVNDEFFLRAAYAGFEHIIFPRSQSVELQEQFQYQPPRSGSSKNFALAGISVKTRPQLHFLFISGSSVVHRLEILVPDSEAREDIVDRFANRLAPLPA